MKIILSIITIVFLGNIAIAQPTKTGSDIIVTPGLGVGNLKLGMSEVEADKLLGGEITWKSYAEELKSFRNMGNNFAIDSMPQFIIGFDSVAVYDGKYPVSIPIYHMYFKNHQLNFITITSYGDDKALANKVRLTNGLKFGDDMDKCKKILKGHPLSIGYGDYDGDYIYYKEGFEIVYDGKKFSCISIFTKTPDFLEKIAAIRDKLMAEFEALGTEAKAE